MAGSAGYRVLSALSCVDPMTGATWVAAGTERLEVVPGLVKSDDEEEGPPRGGSSMTHTYKKGNRKQAQQLFAGALGLARLATSKRP